MSIITTQEILKNFEFLKVTDILSQKTYKKRRTLYLPFCCSITLTLCRLGTWKSDNIYPLLFEIFQAFLQIGCVMLRINGMFELLSWQLLVGWTGLATVVLVQPKWIRLIAPLLHLLHNQEMISIEAIRTVLKNIVDRRMWLTPTSST